MTAVTGSEAGPATQVLDGSSLLWLDDPACVWMVQRGQVQVFAVDRVDGRPTGRHRPLLRVGEGSALMAAPRGSSLALVAAGLEFETTVVPTASGPDPGPSIVGWLTALVRHPRLGCWLPAGARLARPQPKRRSGRAPR